MLSAPPPVAIVLPGAMRNGGIEATLPTDHVTRMGAPKVVALDDGTVLEMDSASVINVDRD